MAHEDVAGLEDGGKLHVIFGVILLQLFLIARHLTIDGREILWGFQRRISSSFIGHYKRYYKIGSPIIVHPRQINRNNSYSVIMSKGSDSVDVFESEA